MLDIPDEMKERMNQMLAELEKGSRHCRLVDQEVKITQCMFCSLGHMTECHYPFTCYMANCTHLPLYSGKPRSKIWKCRLAERAKDGSIDPDKVAELCIGNCDACGFRQDVEVKEPIDPYEDLPGRKN